MNNPFLKPIFMQYNLQNDGFWLTGKIFKVMLFIIIVLGCIPYRMQAQSGSASGFGANQILNVTEVIVEWDSIIPDSDYKKLVTPKIIDAVNIYPNSNVSSFDLDVAQARVVALPEIARVQWKIEMLTSNSIRLIVVVRVTDKTKEGKQNSGIIASGNRKDFPTIFIDEKSYLKFNLAGSMVPTLLKNTWWDNGKTFTEFNPYGKNPPGPQAALDFESYLIAGLSGITRVTNGKIPLFVYGTFNALGVLTLGDELYNQDSNTFKLQTEEAYLGIMGAKTTQSGHLMRFLLSYGKQPYRIGNGMLICQIAGNGGTWGGMNAWPRFSGKRVGLAKFAYDNWRFEGFYIEPNEYENNLSDTKLAGVNAEYNQSYGLSGGATYLNVLDSKFPYFYPDYSQTTREGLNAGNLRFQFMPRPNESFLYAKSEGGIQWNENINMRSYGMAFEGGWSFGEMKNRPTLSYRYSILTGDDPETERFERWDILYSGDDVFTWVQGPLMKNILFNSNLEAHRFQAQLFPQGWRLTGQFSYFLANQLNTVPSPPVGTFTHEQIGQELSLIVERYLSRNIYIRMMATSLWAGKGISEVLPNPVTKPWSEVVAMVKFNF